MNAKTANVCLQPEGGAPPGKTHLALMYLLEAKSNYQTTLNSLHIYTLKLHFSDIIVIGMSYDLNMLKLSFSCANLKSPMKFFLNSKYFLLRQRSVYVLCLSLRYIMEY